MGNRLQAGRLQQQIEFILEIDRLKQVFRQTYLLDASRHENDAEHSWHLAMLAIVLLEYANEPGLDLLKVLKMILVHDLVEIDAGDTFAYDEAGNATKAVRETEAAERIFNLLPTDQAEEMRSLWDAFEAGECPEARYAAALDRLQPLLHNWYTKGKAWREHGVTMKQVLTRNNRMAAGSRTLWQFAEEKIRESAESGGLPRE